MGDVLNLRQARKRIARLRREADARANRVAFGLSKALKTETVREKARNAAALDACLLDDPRHRSSGGLPKPSEPPTERDVQAKVAFGERQRENAAAAGSSPEDGL